MFGYIKPLSGELKVREFELYKSFYCGLCATMGKKLSRLSRLTLSYDMVFLALVRTVLTGEHTEGKRFRCRLKPFKKKHCIAPNASLLYCACVSANLSYHKFKDDLSDSKSRLKKLRKISPLFLLLSHMRKKSRRYHPELEDLIVPPLEKLSGLEAQNCASIDEAASCFAGLMENIFSFGITEPDGLETAKTIGKNLGRWLYMADALDDFERDRKRGDYNPYVAYYKDKDSLIADMDLVKYVLTSNLSGMDEAFSLFCGAAGSCLNPIVFNIINLGLRHRQEQILTKFNPRRDHG